MEIVELAHRILLILPAFFVQNRLSSAEKATAALTAASVATAAGAAAGAAVAGSDVLVD